MCSSPASSDGVLSNESGSLVIKPCTAREIAFYSSAAARPAFAACIPTFFGTLSLSPPELPTSEAAAAAAAVAEAAAKPKHDRNSSIVLQNLAYGFQKPCVLDIKLGAQLWDEGASLEKRERLDAVARKTTSGSLGLRVAGMKVWKGEEAGYAVYDKMYGRTFTAENAVDMIREYLSSTISPEQSKIIAGRFLAQVTAIRAVMESVESRMYSASLLFVYEGDTAALTEALEEEKTRPPKKEVEDEDEEEEEEEEEEDVKMVEIVRLIDFAHATWAPGQGPDENMLQGVRNTQKLFDELD